MRMSRTGTLCSISLAVSMALGAPAFAEDRVGIVTTVIGPVTVARASTPAAPLKFKDDIFLRDRVTTGEQAMTRILMGGKVIVTARERSTLTITEVPGLSTIDLASGRIAVAVDKTRMKPGERVDVRTPTAIAGVRGTVLIVETVRDVSSVTVLRGLVDVVRLDPATGRGIGPVTPVGALQSVTVRNNVLPARAHAITPGHAQALSKEFTPPMQPVAATAVMPVKEEVRRATALLDEILPPPSHTRTGAMAVTSSAATASLSKATAPVLATPSVTASTTLVPAMATTPLVPTATVVPPTQSLLQPIVQPVVQTVVAPVTKLLQ
jgi:hypothetical protein